MAMLTDLPTKTIKKLYTIIKSIKTITIMIYTEKQRNIAMELEKLTNHRFNVESLKKKLTEIFGKEIDGFELGYEDVENFPDWDYMFSVEDNEIGGDFDIYVLMHRSKIEFGVTDTFGNSFYVTEVGYDFTNPIIEKYGREWFEVTNEKYDITQPNWWFVAEFEDGILHMNNDIGVILLIQKDGKELCSYI